MDSRYDHAQTEQRIYQLWEDAQAFNPDVVKTLRQQLVTTPSPANHSNTSAAKSTTKRSTQKPSTFTITMPPPNANDPLHIGHAMFVAIEDILVRFHRMLGDDTVWLPGTDHAGIETQFVFEKKLQKQGKSRFNFDRQTLYNMIWDYVQENSDVAVDQIKKLGASADWSRFTFTLDKPAVEAALSTFKKLHADNLLYRDLQLVHYCTKCGTSYSELEVQHVERTTTLYYVKYQLEEDPSQFITLATTRPEPIYADTHLAVHPNNKKTKHLIGKRVLNPLTNQPMEIIADEFVDPEFGTGIVKLTPAHDFNDFAVAKKHDLPILLAINTNGKMVNVPANCLKSPEGQTIEGLSAEKAREVVVAILKQKGLLDEERTNTAYVNSAGTCYRCGRVLEPLPLSQFFIKVNDEHKSLTQAALKAISSKETTVHGAGYEKILTHWLTNLRDWNISRQIVWGIRIPVWYKVADPQSFTVSYVDAAGTYHQGTLADALTNHPIAEVLKGIQQVFAPQDAEYVIGEQQPELPGTWLPETDTFDTWFSSSQWPITTLRAHRSSQLPTAQDDFKRFYPTSVLETAYDILVFWVMRMMIMGIYLTGSSPFADVYLHGLARDEKGQKMSKSKGNVINPLEIVGEFGADALRMALVIRSTPGIDKSVGKADFKAARNLTNKLWNAARFVLLQRQGSSETTMPVKSAPGPQSAITPEAFRTKLQEIHTDVTQQLRDLKVGMAADTICNEFWHWYCDTCIEARKNDQLSQEDVEFGLISFLKLLHPFMPFITEAIWQELVEQKVVSPSLLIVSPWKS